ncbi:MAG TPA: acylphosphatase [Bacteroidales bacterium]|nr:acylphosphatase [Bacteroidales bacterium]
MENKKLYRITINGRVQGVGFRRHAEREAILRGLTGFVRNLDDGRVYIEAEGPGELLDDFLSWCGRGPALSRVRSVDVEKGIPEGYTEFRIEH